MTMEDVKAVSARMNVGSPMFDGCGLCFSLMTDAINDLLESILNGGVIGGCNELCATLSNSIESAACNFICDYVGIEAFVDAINMTDPDPIYACQEIDLCPIVTGGAATMNSVTASPKSGPTGTNFNVTMIYTVTAATGPGYLVVDINCPDGNSLGGSVFSEGQAPGKYGMVWEIGTQPSEQEAFGPGSYQAIVGVCEGDCTTDHPNGGVYAAGQTVFSITQ